MTADDLLKAAKNSGNKTSGNPNSVMSYKNSSGKVKTQNVSNAVQRNKTKSKKK